MHYQARKCYYFKIALTFVACRDSVLVIISKQAHCHYFIYWMNDPIFFDSMFFVQGKFFDIIFWGR